MSSPVALVTGCSRGIGRAIADRMLAAGFHVIGTATRPDAADEMPPGVEFLPVDFASTEELERFCRRVRELPRLDACINNAGINRIKPIDQVTAADYRAVLSVDLDAPYAICQAAAAVLTRPGRIVNIASIWSVATKAQRSLYSTAKTGLLGLTRALAAELGPSGILVNAVSPGFVLTDLTRRSLSETEIAALCEQIPCRRMADPAEIAELVAFLAGPANTYLTGQNVVIDGGFTIV
ncbi:MAG: SDR family oxidoreductase [Verrucomicrobiota bacterium]